MFQIDLQHIHSVSLVDRRGYLTVVMGIEKEDNLIVRRPENLRDWYNKVQRMVQDCKTRDMQSTKEFWTKKLEKYPQPVHQEQRPSSTVSLDRRRRRDKSRCK